MQDEALFSPDEVVISNISRLSCEQALLEEERICELAELASLAAETSLYLFEDGMGAVEALSLISDGALLEANEAPECMPENLSRLRSYCVFLSAQDRAFFSELYLSRLKERGVYISEKDFLPSRSGGESFVYLRNGFADEAYDVFSQELSDPRVRYAASLRDAVSQVAEGGCDFCLLPLEERGSRLQAVAELLFRSDLKINFVTPVFGFDGSADMKYAAVSKGFSVPEVREDDDRYLEIRLPNDGDSTAELLTVASALGSTLYRIGTVYFDTEEGRKPYLSLVLRDEGREFTALLVYLTLFSRGFTAVGIYKNLE